MTIGAALLVQGSMQVLTRNGTPLPALLTGMLSIGAGICLAGGFLTPLAAGASGLELAGWWMRVIPRPPASLFDANLTLVFALTIAIVILLLGPGAFSIDARLFGRREILIPPGPSDPEIEI